MFDAEEIRWVKSTANELNNLLQVITESSQFLENQCDNSAETHKYFDILRNGVERAAQVTRLMIERVGEFERGSLPEKVFESQKPTAMYGMKPPKPEPPAQEDLESSEFADIKVFNPTGPKELVMIVDDE